MNGCSNLTEIKGLNHFNTAKVTTMMRMFKNCLNLTELDLSSFNTGLVTDMDGMFSACNELQEVTLGEKFLWVEGNNTYLPLQKSTDIPGATGLWYDIETGKGYAPEEVPDGKLATYCATPVYTE